MHCGTVLRVAYVCVDNVGLKLSNCRLGVCRLLIAQLVQQIDHSKRLLTSDSSLSRAHVHGHQALGFLAGHSYCLLPPVRNKMVNSYDALFIRVTYEGMRTPTFWAPISRIISRKTFGGWRFAPETE